MSGSEVIITSPPDDGDGLVANPSRVKVTIVYDPPEFMDQKTVKRITKALQREADKTVAKFG